VLEHEAAQRGAVFAEIALLQLVGFLPVDVEGGGDVVADALADLVEEVRARRIEGVVEIENPGVDVSEVGAARCRLPVSFAVGPETPIDGSGAAPVRTAAVPFRHDDALAPAWQPDADESFVAVDHRVEGVAGAQLAGVQDLADRRAGLTEFRRRNAGSAQDLVQSVASPDHVLQREGHSVQCFRVEREGVVVPGDAA